MVMFTLVLIVDIVIYALVLKQHNNMYLRPSVGDIEFRSQYIALDFLYTQNDTRLSHYGPINNDPMLVVQMNSSEPHSAANADLHEWMSPIGTLSPKDRHFKVSSTVSLVAYKYETAWPYTPQIHTVAQFHVMDYGMEICKIVFKLPQHGDILLHPYTLPVTDTLHLEICILDTTHLRYVGSLSWASRPTCTATQHITAIVGEVVESEALHCKSGSIIALLVSCDKKQPNIEQCEADIWSNQYDTWGRSICIFIYIYIDAQHCACFIGLFVRQYQGLL